MLKKFLVLAVLLISVAQLKNAMVDFTKRGSDNQRKNVAIELGDTITIKLNSNPSTGYTWNILPELEANCIPKVKLRSENYQVPNGQKRIGQGGEVTYTFDSILKGTQKIQMAYVGPSSPRDRKSIEQNSQMKFVIVDIQEKSQACGAI